MIAYDALYNASMQIMCKVDDNFNDNFNWHENKPLLAALLAALSMLGNCRAPIALQHLGTRYLGFGRRKGEYE